MPRDDSRSPRDARAPAGVELMRHWVRERLHESLEPWATPYIDAAMSGDADAAFSLTVATSNPKRGAVAVALYRARIPVPAFRASMRSVWEHDHRYLIEAAGNRRTLRAMFRYAQFPVSEHLPPTVRAWRGTSYLTHKQAARGYSWTLDRDVACWFAMRFAEHNRRPLVLVTEVPREAISFYSDERGEREALLFDPGAVSVDGTPEDWHRCYTRHEAEIRRHNEELMARAPTRKEDTDTD